jgi:predicted glycosyltransferase involved in capsule biosynthesis
MVYDLKGITFCFHVRIDTEERLRNIQIITNYYRKHCSNFQFIFFEDAQKPTLLNHINLTDNDKYIFVCNNSEWIKARGFNTGARLSDNNILVFHDIDVILHPEQLLEGKTYLNDSPKTGLLYPNDGLFIFAKQELKDKFATSLDYDILYENLPPIRQVLYETKFIKVVDTQTVGGGVMARKDNFLLFKGYNPFFKGWGYEDDEIAHRVHKLGYDVVRLNNKPIWHLPHTGINASKRETNEFHEQNKSICSWVGKQTKESLEEYINTWNNI